jgi:hypothetical protein
MQLEKYMLALLPSVRPERLGPSPMGRGDNMILYEFSRRPVLSAYRIYSMFERGEIYGESMAYKNTFIHVKNLLSLGFIKQVEREGNPKHGAIYYRITEAGILWIFTTRSYFEPSFLSTILDNHGDHLIFDCFLYPCFKKETLTAIMTGEVKILKIVENNVGAWKETGAKYLITNSIIEYLVGCCKWVNSLLSTVSERPAGTKPGKLFLELFNNEIALLKDVLVTKILLHLRQVENKDQMKALSILVRDERFMKIARDLQTDFNKSIDFAMQLRTGS